MSASPAGQTQAVIMASSSTILDRADRVPNRPTARPALVEEASDEALPASDARSRMPGSIDAPPSEMEVVRRCGRFALLRDLEGLRWVLTSRTGSVWYWHAESKQWLAACHGHGTEEEATAGLKETLAHEQVGDLDEQHAAPRPGHGPTQL
jgi:hypothetical protein